MSPLETRKTTTTSFLVFLYILPVIGLSAVALISVRSGIPMYKFMRDPSRIGDISPLAGVISNIGVLMWCASAAICLFSWTLLRYRENTAQFVRFVLYFGFMTIILLIDDLFLGHESISAFGISDKVIYGVYVVIVLCGILTFKDTILKTEYSVLLVALCFFALSIFFDIIQHYIQAVLGQWRIFLEDGFKLLGIIGWFGYWSSCCFSKINEAGKA